jgi:hypothetical protein
MSSTKILLESQSSTSGPSAKDKMTPAVRIPVDGGREILGKCHHHHSLLVVPTFQRMHNVAAKQRRKKR